MSSDFWWESDKKGAFEKVFEHVRAIEEDQKFLQELHIRNARLYSNDHAVGIDWTIDKRDIARRPGAAFTTENVIQSVIDTATAMIAKSRPKPAILTDGAEYSVQRRAKKLDLALQGIYQSADVYRTGPDFFRDACIFGTGVLHPFDDNSKVAVEKVLPDEIIVDERECRCTPPREMHRRKFADKEVVKAMFPEFETEIENANEGNRKEHTSFRRIDDNQVVIVESWHLPSIAGADDGKHAISIDNATLLWEEFEDDDFPFVFAHWSPPVTGFWGQGLSQQLTGIQLRINKLNKFIDRAQDLIANPRIFVDVASKVLKQHINNEIGAIVPYRGRPPTFLTPQAVGAEIYNYKEVLKQSAFELAGISRLSAQAQKPAGLESAVALREFTDIETQRFAIQAQNYEQAIAQDLAKKIVKVAKAIHGKDQKFTTVFAAKGFMQKIDWADVDMEEDRFVMKVEASSLLSRTPAGKTQTVIEWLNAQFISQDEAKQLLDLPDIDKAKSMFNAAIDNIDAMIEQALDGEMIVPEPFMNLPLGIQRFQQAYLRSKIDGAPEDILQILRDWMELAQNLIAPAPTPETEAAPPGLPPEAGGPAPAIAPAAGPLAPVPPTGAIPTGPPAGGQLPI